MGGRVGSVCVFRGREGCGWVCVCWVCVCVCVVIECVGGSMCVCVRGGAHVIMCIK